MGFHCAAALRVFASRTYGTPEVLRGALIIQYPCRFVDTRQSEDSASQQSSRVAGGFGGPGCLNARAALGILGRTTKPNFFFFLLTNEQETTRNNGALQATPITRFPIPISGMKHACLWFFFLLMNKRGTSRNTGALYAPSISRFPIPISDMKNAFRIEELCT